MNGWDKTRQDDKFKKKLQSVKSTMHKLFNCSPNNSSNNTNKKIYSGATGNKTQPISALTKNRIFSKTDTNERNNIPNGIHQDPNIYGNRVENFQRQQILRRFLKEFGLGQYLRKFYELGYDDTNISKLANLTLKEIDEFIEMLRIFPGHRIKVLSLIDRIAIVYRGNKTNTTRNNFRSVGYNTSGNINQKRFHSTGQTRLKITNMKQLATVYGMNRNVKHDKKPKSVEPIRSKNRIIKNFLNNEGFGFNYYMKDKNDMSDEEYNQIVDRGISGQTENSDNKGKAELINEEIDKMLNFYMTRLNEKIDDSYDESDEDEINLKNFPPVNDFMNMNNDYQKEYINNITIKNNNNTNNTQPSKSIMNNSTNIENEKSKTQNFPILKENLKSNSFKKEINKNADKSRLSEQNNSKKDSTLKLEEDSSFKNFNYLKKNSENNIEDNIYEEDFHSCENKKIKTECLENKNECSRSSIKSEIIIKTENSHQNQINRNIENNEKPTLNIKYNSELVLKLDNAENRETQHNLSNLNIEDCLYENFNESNNFTEEKKVDKINTDSSSLKIQNLAKNCKEIELKEKEIGKKRDFSESTESLDLSYIRLNRSCEADYVQQTMDQFDIEYMCRCLGMALMKHLEASKEKNHVMELVNNKEGFSFFNSIYNKNINFLLTFFNMENKIEQVSNLDKLDYYQNNETDKEEIKIKSCDKEKYENKNDTITEKEHPDKFKIFQTISYLTHIKSSHDQTSEHKDFTKFEENVITGMNDYDKDFSHSKTKKADIEKELATIQEFFKNSTKSVKYKNVSEATKNIMAEELNSIHEVDSIEYCKINKLFTGEMQDKQMKNHEYINLLKESVHNLFSNNSNNEDNENLDIINENNKIGINEEEMDDDFINYEDIDKDLEQFEINAKEIDLKESITDNKQESKQNLENFEKSPNKNKFSNYNIQEEPELKDNAEKLKNFNHDYEDHNISETPYNNVNFIDEDIKEKEEMFESGLIESNYIIDIANADKLKNFILKTSEVYDDDYDYISTKILQNRFVQMPDPQAIFEFCANVMILTKMEKEVIIISLIYMERFIFNTGVLINSRNWKRILFTSLIIASKIWDDDSFENNHFAQVFTHLKIGEINLLERTFLELINYKVFVKCSEYFKYFFIIKSIALKYNFNGFNLVPISIERMMKVQEYAFLAQKKFKKKYSYNNSAEF